MGCPPAAIEDENRYLHPAAAGLMSGGIQDLVRADVPLVRAQADVLLPPPDLVLPLSGLQELLEAQPGLDQECIAEQMERAYGGFLWSREQRGQEHERCSNWRDDEAFMGCKLWLYEWNTPAEISICCIVPRKTGILASTYVLMDGNVVANVGGLLRRKPGR